jgi:fumarate hydratase class II
MVTSRIERDSMGEVKVPAQALYGAQTQRAVENFTISSEPMPWLFIETVLQIKLAAARANHQLGLLSARDAQLIASAAQTLIDEKQLDQFPVPILQTGSGTSTNMNVNEVIVGLVKNSGVTLSPNDHINLGQSSNDVIPTAINIIAASLVSMKLLVFLEELAEEIRNVARANSDVIKTGRTHLMDALPIRLTDELEAWALQIDECQERFTDCLKRLVQVPLGGTAVGSGVNCHPRFAELALADLSELTGLKLTRAVSSFKGQSSLDTFVELSGHFKTCAVVLSKIANDLRWMNSGPLSGLSEVRLPALQPGSSIMPAKVNPVVPEAVLMAMAQVIGNDTTISLAGLGGSFQLNTMLPLTGAKLIESAELLSGSCNLLGQKCIRQMVINRESFARGLSLNPILVTSLNPVIGYDMAAKIGKIALQENRPIIDVAAEHTDIDRSELEKLLDPSILASGGRRT